MTIAVYPGSFNPWHAGHQDVLTKVIKTFDKVVVAIGINLEKEDFKNFEERLEYVKRCASNLPGNIEVVSFSGLFKNFIEHNDYNVVIKGIRNIQDFEYEKSQQYHNEDLGVSIPTFYVISDRKLVHISSSAIRQIKGVE